MTSHRNGTFQTYKQTLAAISARTGTPLSSLFLSFGILHELTAIVPFGGFFYGARMMGIGEHVVFALSKETTEESGLSFWTRQKVRKWVHDGDLWAIKVGRRYGIFGYEKRAHGVADDVEEMAAVSGRISGDVANAIFAYGATKALLPIRIAASLYLSPKFSRSIVEPSRKLLVNTFRKGP